jgi:hypothetical protein
VSVNLARERAASVLHFPESTSAFRREAARSWGASPRTDFEDESFSRNAAADGKRVPSVAALRLHSVAGASG